MVAILQMIGQRRHAALVCIIKFFNDNYNVSMEIFFKEGLDHYRAFLDLTGNITRNK